MNVKKTLFIICMLFGLLFAVFSSPTVKAVVNSAEFYRGDLVKVLIKVEDNPGLHGLFFDLDYDESVLTLESVRDGSFIRRLFDTSEFAYAVSDETSTLNLGSHVVVGYSLKGKGTESDSSGSFVELAFRVHNVGAPDAEYAFTFSGAGIFDGTGAMVPGVTWQDSRTFSIRDEVSTDFILIKKPYDNQIIYDVTSCPVSLICTEGDYTVTLENDRDVLHTIAGIPVKDGRLLDTMMTIEPGFNMITASLYEAGISSPKATHKVKVYMSEDSSNLRIISPKDHSLLNTDMVDVEVASAGDAVEINGMNAAPTGEMYGSNKIYRARIWLQPGFNTITAMSRQIPEGDQEERVVTYSDSISVYYRKDSSIFNFILPAANRGFKPSHSTNLYIKGEIDSLYQTLDTKEVREPELNTVHLSVVYRPLNANEAVRYLVDDRQAVIADNNYTGYNYGLASSKYVFYNDFEIPLTNLDDGEIIIKAYKNKVGDTWDDVITRIIHVDNKRLWIDLVQPNVFTSDELDSKQNIKTFNENQPLDTSGNIDMTVEGKLQLTASDVVVEALDRSDVFDMIQTPDGALYALVNTDDGRLIIYKKELGASVWKNHVSAENVYGYDLCYTELGILVGTSNMYQTDNSGLYLLNNNDALINIDFEEMISHVQFVTNIDGTIYLYGNNYTHLYQFSTTSMEVSAEDNRLIVNALGKTSFSNFLNIKEFELFNGGKTACIRTDEAHNNIRFYQKTAAGYSAVTLPKLNDSVELTGNRVIVGRYTEGYYDAVVIPKNGDMVEVIMVNRALSGKIIRNELPLDALLQEVMFDSLLGIGFKDDAFTFVYQTNTEYVVKRGKVFFNVFNDDPVNPRTVYGTLSNTMPDFHDEAVFLTNNNTVLIGVDRDELNTTDYPLYSFSKKMQETGTVSFNYVNDDIEGLKGFEFDVESLWLKKAGSITFGFTLQSKAGATADPGNDPVLFALPAMDLVELVDQIKANNAYETEKYTITKEYDDNAKLDTIHVEFKDEYAASYIHFTFAMTAADSNSPYVANIEVFKKVKAKISRPDDGNVVIPIHGYVYDRTVKEVNIGHMAPIGLGWDGSFYATYEVKTDETLIPIEISCKNGALEKETINFTVELVDSLNDVWGVQYKTSDDGVYKTFVTANDEVTVSTEEDYLILSGKYYGLRGCIVGYESRAKNTDGEESVINRGMFSLTPDNAVADEVSVSLSPEYETGEFIDQRIPLVPGAQSLVIYCENPGGRRVEYMVDELHPKIYYDIPEDQQGVYFDINPMFSHTETQSNVAITHNLPLDVKEGAAPDYVFSRQYVVTGYIKSLYTFKDILIKDLTEYNGQTGKLYFGGGTEDQVTVPVGAGNRFQFTVTLVMDEELEQQFYIGAIPTLPMMNKLKRGIKVSVKKNFENIDLRAYFDDMAPANWLPEHNEAAEIPFMFTFNRRDIPLNKKTDATFYVNYEHIFTGWVDVYDEARGLYCIKDESGTPVVMPFNTLHTGKNRIQWKFSYNEAVDATSSIKYPMSSSFSTAPGKSDFIFEYYPDQAKEDTIIEFLPGLTDRYYNNTDAKVPDLSLTKDVLTMVSSVTLNGLPVSISWVRDDSLDRALIKLADLPAKYFSQGRNKLVVTYKEFEKSPTVKEYLFLYDTALPVVHIEDYALNTDKESAYFLNVDSLSASITEANFKITYLYYDNSIINVQPEITIRGKDGYYVVWNNLEHLGILPSAEKPVKVEAIDHAGNKAFSEEFTGFNLTAKPISEPPESVKLEDNNTHSFNFDNGPLHMENEENYMGRLFSNHFKFAPRKYLKKVYITNHVQDGKLLLIENGQPNVTTASTPVPVNTDLMADYNYKNEPKGVDEPFGKFLVVKVAKDPYIPLLVMEDFKDKIQFKYFGYKLESPVGEGDPKTSEIGPATISLPVEGQESSFATWLEGRDYFYFVIQLYDDDINDIQNDSSGLRKLFYDAVSPYASGETKHLHSTLTMELNIGPSGTIIEPADVYLTGDDTTALSDVIMYDRHYEDYEHYQVNVKDIISQNDISLINNEKKIDVKLAGSNANNVVNSAFGKSVSLFGDYALIGAPFETSSEQYTTLYTGAVYLFKHDAVNDSWNEVVRITPKSADKRHGLLFGESVAINDSHIVIGAPGYDKTVENEGAVFVYTKPTGTSWEVFDFNTAAVKMLQETSLAAYQDFGNAVALNNNLLVVGAHGKNNFSGAAYVYEYKNNDWVGCGDLLPDTNEYNWFGRSVATDGTLVVVGAPGEAGDTGAVYVYSKVGTSWNQSEKLTSALLPVGSQYGEEVAVNGNYIAVGAPYTDVAPSGQTYTNGGVVVIHEKIGASRSQTLLYAQEPAGLLTDGADAPAESFKVKPAQNDFYGSSLAFDVYNGTLRLLVGAVGDNFKDGQTGPGHLASYSHYRGSAYLYELKTGTWQTRRKLFNRYHEPVAEYGNAVALSGDHLLVGAFRNDYVDPNNGTYYTNTGAAFITDSSQWTKESFLDSLIVTKDGGAYDPESKEVFPFDYLQYLVFKVKNTNGEFGTLDDIKGKITFEFTTKWWDLNNNGAQYTDNLKGAIVPISLEEGTECWYEERPSYLIYAINRAGIEKLLERYNEEIGKVSTNFSSDSWTYKEIIDRGSLRLRYGDGLANDDGTPKDEVEVYSSTRGRDEVGSLHVADYSYQFFSTVKDHNDYKDFSYENDDFYRIHPYFNYTKEQRSLIKKNTSELLTINFWIRLEDEGLDQGEDVYHHNFKRVLTLLDPTGLELLKMGYKGHPGEKTTYFYFYDQDGNAFPILDGNYWGPVNPNGGENWNMITLAFDKQKMTFSFYLNGNLMTSYGHTDETAFMDAETLGKIMDPAASYYFGSMEHEEYNTGFFSVAEVKYQETIYEEAQIARMMRYEGINELKTKYVQFSSATGPEDSIDISGIDYAASNNNAYYTMDERSNKSFKASSVHDNVFVLKEDSNAGGKIPVLESVDNQPLAYDIEVKANINLKAGDDLYTGGIGASANVYTGTSPMVTLGGTMDTVWTVDGIDDYVVYDFKSIRILKDPAIAFGHEYTQYFEIWRSFDNDTWTPVLSVDENYTGSMEVDGYRVYPIPNLTAQYIKIVNKGNSSIDEHEKNKLSIVDVVFNIATVPNYDTGFALYPQKNKTGRFFFGNKHGNYGLKQDRWYSIGGYVCSLEAGKTADLVMSVNGVEQRMTLREGPFHFVYNNHDAAIPAEVQVYVETDGTVAFAEDLTLNAGNFTVTRDIEKTFATTRYHFDLTGTVQFWYKPLIANKDGYVNYPVEVAAGMIKNKITLFDSEYIRIGAYKPADSNDAAYYAQIKSGPAGTVDPAHAIYTNVKVTNEWQHLRFSYDILTGVAYFYINGKLAGHIEKPDAADPLPSFGSITGEDIPLVDNVWIGCSGDLNSFAEGYIDNFDMMNGKPSYEYQPNDPVGIVYDKEALVLRMDEIIPGGDITKLLCVLESLETDEVRIYEQFPIDLALLPGGRYRATTSMVFNGHDYNDITTFNLNEKPRFELQYTTPVIFEKNASRLDYTFLFDHAYRLEDKSLYYAGAAIKIMYNDSNGAPTEVTRYLVQDFKQQKFDSWISGYYNGASPIEWSAVQPSNEGFVTVDFANVQSSSDVRTEIKYFYFKDMFTPVLWSSNDANGPEEIVTISKASLVQEASPLDAFGNPYMLALKIDGDMGTGSGDFFKDITLDYTVINDETNARIEGMIIPDQNGRARLYYDNVMTGYAPHHAYVSLMYQGKKYAELPAVMLDWKEHTVDEGAGQTEASTSLTLEDFSLLYLDKQRDTVSLSVQYDYENVGDITMTLMVKQGARVFGDVITKTLDKSVHNEIISTIAIPKNVSEIEVTLKAVSHVDENVIFYKSDRISVDNRVSVPEVIFTNSVDSLITYNDVFFTWKGYYEGAYNEHIEYSYNFDGSGWSTPSAEWRSIRFYELAEGLHEFKVKAVMNGVWSREEGRTFFVDVNKPVFNKDLIRAQEVVDNNGVCYAINITGSEKAITDISLDDIYINGIPATSVSEDTGYPKVIQGVNGSFEGKRLPLYKDGKNEFVITAVDKAGNYTEHTVTYNNTLTTILYPAPGVSVKYSPLTLVGMINGNINAVMDIYVRDPFCTDGAAGDYTGWKKATINPDRMFFVENVFVNPGTADKEIATTLEVKTVFASGKEFTRELVVTANEIIMPIELELSAHAAEGENGDTSVLINAQANLDGISSWSVDFDGDGVYDVVDMCDNPDSPEAKSRMWTHKYSSLGLVKPRVRVITIDGHFFSVSDTLIIHEKIKEASNKMLTKPVSCDTVRMADRSERIFVLGEKDTRSLIEVYEVGRNETYISNKLFTIDLDTYGIESADVIRTIGGDYLVVGVNNEAESVYTIYGLKKNTFGNYEIDDEIAVSGEITDIVADEAAIVVSYAHANYFTKIDIVDGSIAGAPVEEVIPAVYHTIGMGANAGIAKDRMGFLIADFMNQRIIRMSESLTMKEQFGIFGIGEKEFIKPAIVKSFENRIFVYDDGRKDIQVFDGNYTPVCTLGYDAASTEGNYFTNTFLNDVADMNIIAREDGNRIYYYALILSKSDEKLAMLRLPQWEELRTRVRNNTLVFIKDGEVHSSKPDGGDLLKVISTDSMPRIEGEVDYPALAPDGKSLVFTSRIRLYNGEDYGFIDDTNVHAYDNLYLVDLETKAIDRLDLGMINNYELERPVFNYNGDKLIFSAKPTGGKWQIFIYDIASRATVQLFESNEHARFPYYSPDDRFVVFTTDYDGDEDIAIIDVDNPNVRVYVTDNNARDSLPVWSRIYPLEINTNDDVLKDVTTKIAFVSERDFHKGVYTVYLKRMSDNDIQVFDLAAKAINGEDPDMAAIALTNAAIEGDYPCFTGDGRSLLFEHYDGTVNQIKRFDYKGVNPDDTTENGDKNNAEMIKDAPAFIFETVTILEGARRPAGMKNTITNFAAQSRNGNEISLAWDRYTEQDIFYTVQFKQKSDSSKAGEKTIFDQEEAVITGLDLGMTYLVRVCIEELGEVVATSQWKEVKMPLVVARPTITIDEDNPYLVHLSAWKPDADTSWKFSWFIDNTKIDMGIADEYHHHFGTQGKKTVVLMATNSTATEAHMSDPVEVEIISDIEPVIEHVLTDDSGSITLNAGNSRGSNIDYTTAQWIISGAGRDPLTVIGKTVTASLTGFKHKINVTLRLSRIPVSSQPTTDTLEKHIVIDLDFKEVEPVITMKTSDHNEQLIMFSGENSLGNIDWYRAKWALYGDNSMIYQVDGVSAFEYQFPELNKTRVYTVTLTLPRANDGMAQTRSKIVHVGAAPIEPIIRQKTITMKKGDNFVGYKIILDCTESMGNNIDFANARWSIPGVDVYGEQPVQMGPVAVFNLLGIAKLVTLDVALTLSRMGGKDPMTHTEFITLTEGGIPIKEEFIVNESVDLTTDTSHVITLDVLKSTGPNIQWEKTHWLFDGQYPKQGPIARYDVPIDVEKKTVQYTCTLYRFGTEPEVKHGTIDLKATSITPVISVIDRDHGFDNVVELSVLETKGYNIDWSRTEWFIYDGNEGIVQKRGASITHAFVLKEGAMGYPVMVKMFMKGSSRPIIKYKSVDVDTTDAGVFKPVISIETDASGDIQDSNVVILDAHQSIGANIEWAQTKWTIVETAQTLHGPVVSYKFPFDDEKKTYNVRLTLFRRLSNGTIESKTSVKKVVAIEADTINPVITAKLEPNGYMVLSAANSEGRGLMLDRSVWAFPAKGDNTSYSEHIRDGTIKRSSHNHKGNFYANGNLTVYAHTQGGFNIGGEKGTFVNTGARSAVHIGGGYNYDYLDITETADYSAYTDGTSSFSTSNMHTGVICRRYIGTEAVVTATLLVYRVNGDGTTEGESITVIIDSAKAAAEDGVSYDSNGEITEK